MRQGHSGQSLIRWRLNNTGVAVKEFSFRLLYEFVRLLQSKLFHLSLINCHQRALLAQVAQVFRIPTQIVHGE